MEENENVKGKTQLGTPTMVLLPAANYHFKVIDDQCKITVTRAGTYKELDPEFFKEDDGEFNLYDTENDVMYLPAITKVLFAERKYPALKANQLFAPVALVFDEETVDIIGQVIEVTGINKEG